jgi:two-component system, NarL family, response regulator LiaR
VREGLAALLERDESVKIVGFAATGEEALLAERRLRPDVLIMDLMLPGLNGIEATRRILSVSPRARILVLSACHSTDHVYRALRAGALGYVLKSEWQPNCFARSPSEQRRSIYQLVNCGFFC